MRFIQYLYLATAIVLCITGISCVKDVDFDQAQEITMQPEIQTDLLIFEVDQMDFKNPGTNQLKKIIRDTVRLEFLDDNYIQNDLEQVEFSFKYRNTFSQTFFNKISFLSEEDVLQHQVDFLIAAGTPESPEVTEEIDLIAPNGIEAIKRSIKMVVEIEIISDHLPNTGKLNFESKGLFSFQF